jgi:hypothetical protein
MLDSLSRSHSIPFRDLLGGFSRDELKLACQRLDLATAGRERRTLTRRILAADRQERASKSSRKTKGVGRSSHGGAETLKTVRRSKGTSQFMDGVKNMDEPKVISQSADALSNREEPQRVELVWAGKRKEVDRVVLPFQPIEIVNESRATREAEKATSPLMRGQIARDAAEQAEGWRNKLIWGDNKYVLSSLLERFAGQIDLIYIDPPFATGQDFSMQMEVGGKQIIKEASLIEEKAYRDTCNGRNKTVARGGRVIS